MKLTGLITIVLVTMTGCASVGPKTVPHDQFNYNAAIAESSQEQLLLNLVRLRYNETPVFLKVGSVISQYSRIASANAAVGANTSVVGDNTASAGGRLSWADRPTITYIPISGQEFARNLLTPIPPSAIFNMVQSGWPADLVLPLTVWSINQIGSDIARPSSHQQADPELAEMLKVWRRLRDSGELGVRRAPVKDGHGYSILFLREGPLSGQAANDFQRFAELLGIDPQARQFPMTYGLVPEKENGIAVLTGSIWEIMLNIAWQFEVPARHIQNGRTGETFQSTHQGGAAPIEVQFSEQEPDDAYVTVQAHGYWFYIDQRDPGSKRTFSFLQLLLNLAETSTPDATPVFTISN